MYPLLHVVYCSMCILPPHSKQYVLSTVVVARFNKCVYTHLLQIRVYYCTGIVNLIDVHKRVAWNYPRTTARYACYLLYA